METTFKTPKEYLDVWVDGDAEACDDIVVEWELIQDLQPYGLRDQVTIVKAITGHIVNDDQDELDLSTFTIINETTTEGLLDLSIQLDILVDRMEIQIC